MRLHRRIFARALQRRCHTSPVHELPDEKDKSKRRGVAAPFDSWPVIRGLVTAALLFATASWAFAKHRLRRTDREPLVLTRAVRLTLLISTPPTRLAEFRC